MSKERLLVAKATEIQLRFAVDLLRQAVANLTALQYGIHPALEDANRALVESEKALACTEVMLKRIPEPDGWLPSR